MVKRMIEQTTMPADDDPVLKIKDIARRTQLSERFIYEQTIKGNIEHYVFGGSKRKRGAIRYSERQFRQFLTRQIDQCQPVTGIAASGNLAATFTKRPNSTTTQLNQLLRKRRA